MQDTLRTQSRCMHERITDNSNTYLKHPENLVLGFIKLPIIILAQTMHKMWG